MYLDLVACKVILPWSQCDRSGEEVSSHFAISMSVNSRQIRASWLAGQGYRSPRKRHCPTMPQLAIFGRRKKLNLRRITSFEVYIKARNQPWILRVFMKPAHFLHDYVLQDLFYDFTGLYDPVDLSSNWLDVQLITQLPAFQNHHDTSLKVYLPRMSPTIDPSRTNFTSPQQ